MTEKADFLIDFAATELDDRCGMSFWLSTLEGGRGIQHKTSILPALLLAETHADLRAIAALEDIGPVAIQKVIDGLLEPLSEEDREDVTRMELLYRRLGWLAAFALYVEPGIRMDYHSVPLDSEILLDRTPLWVTARPDRLLRSKTDGDISYREYVLMPPGVNQKWLHTWLFNMRVHLGIAAASEETKQGITYGQIMGLMEGYYSVLDGHLMHPYVWGYHKHQTQEWSNVFKTEKEGWLPTPVWKFPGGVVAWVRHCGQHIADAQFPLSPEITFNKPMLDNWVERQLHRARAIRVVKDASVTNQHLRGIHFEQKTATCRPLIGEPCQFLAKCWGQPKVDDYVPNEVLA